MRIPLLLVVTHLLAFVVALGIGAVLAQMFVPKYTPVRVPVEAQSVLYIGDSKTSIYLISATNRTLTEASGRITVDYPTPLAAGGWTLAEVYRQIENGALDWRTGTPTYVLMNVGANDADNHPNWQEWERQYATVLDALHAAYPDAQVFAALPYRAGFEAECEQMSAIIRRVVGSRAWAHVGPDERVVLREGQATKDGTHPLPIGYEYMAQAWRETIYG